MADFKIHVANDFSPFPAGRYPEDSDYCGERFRDEMLAPALLEFDKVFVDLDDVLALGSSFLEESFGGLVRHYGFSYDDLRKKIVVTGGVQSDRDLVWDFIRAAKSEVN